MTFTAARDLFADAQSFPSLFDGAAEPTVTDAVAVEPTATDAAAVEPTVTDAAVVEPTVTDAAVVDPSLAVESATPGGEATAPVAEPTAPAAAETISTTFAELGVPRRLVETLQRGGITSPFPIQAATIPDAIAGRDVLGRGQTGSGKTLAFGLPIIIRLSNAGKAAPGPSGGADSRADARTRHAGQRRHRPARPDRRAVQPDRVRREPVRQADPRPPARRRHPRRHARAASVI